MTPAGLSRYIEFMCNVSEARLAALADLVTDEVIFRDPFNDLRGREAFARCMHEMLEQVGELRISVTHVGPLAPVDGTAEEQRHVLRWTFDGVLRSLGNRPWSVTGMSEVWLATDGRVSAHIDYWDAARGLYEHLPLVGSLVRWLRRRLALKGVTQYQDAAARPQACSMRSWTTSHTPRRKPASQ